MGTTKFRKENINHKKSLACEAFFMIYKFRISYLEFRILFSNLFHGIHVAD
jgi:hypothetical protein